jgi:hypothetical protein
MILDMNGNRCLCLCLLAVYQKWEMSNGATAILCVAEYDREFRLDLIQV